MDYVTPAYETQLTELAERLVTPERFAPHLVERMAQLALFDIVQKPEV